MNILKFLLGLLLGVLVCVVPLNQFQTTPLEPLQTLAVQLDGRKKPLDTLAWETVAKIHGSPRYRQPNGETLTPMQTFLSLWFNDRDWNQEPFVLFSYRPLKQQVGLDVEQKYFSFQALMQSDLGQVVRLAHQKQASDEELTRSEREALTLEDRLALMLRTVGDRTLPLVPHPTDLKGTWVSLEAAQTLYGPEPTVELLAQFEQVRQVYLADPAHAPLVGQLATTLQQNLVNLSPAIYPQTADLQQEVWFHRFHPFAKAWMLYTLAFVAMLLALWLQPRHLYWGAMGIFVTGVVINGYGFVQRMQIAGRPPVTNMYESVVWVGFGMAVLALLFELIYRAKYYLLAAAPLSVLCLLLADRLPAVLDPSIGPLVPVLRDNFWLSVHVPTITLSYAGFALAMGLGHVILGHYLFAPQATGRIQYLSRLNYQILQVGVLLLTTGIILGGIWAHFSWGRFWGWDPKETWALIALLCYLTPLHGRLTGWIGNLGISVASVVSFNAVLMAWYGVNFVLGTGLHSYGFSTGGSELMVAGIVAIDLLFVGVAVWRYRLWQGRQPEAEAKPAPYFSSLPDVLEPELSESR